MSKYIINSYLCGISYAVFANDCLTLGDTFNSDCKSSPFLLPVTNSKGRFMQLEVKVSVVGQGLHASKYQETANLLHKTKMNQH